MIYVEGTTPDEDTARLLEALAESLQRLSIQLPPARKTDDEYVEILKARELAQAAHLMGSATRIVGPPGFEWTMISKATSDETLEPSPLNRTIVVKRYRSIQHLRAALYPQAGYLQTVGYCLDDSELEPYARMLGDIGVTRLCPFGRMTFPIAGTPHDGRYELYELVNYLTIEGERGEG